MDDESPPDKSPEELVRRFKELVARFDAELTKAGLSEEQREQLVKEVLEEEPGETGSSKVGA